MSDQRGIAHLLLLIAVVGILVFLIITNVFQFKNGIFSRLFPKSASHAATLAPAFPRIATIYSKNGEDSSDGKKGIAKFSLYVTDFGWWPYPCANPANCDPSLATLGTTTVGQFMKKVNPNLIAVAYVHANGFGDGGWGTVQNPP